MDPYQALLELARLLLAEDGPEPAARTLLLRLLEASGAERGFVVVREGGGYEQKFDVRYDRTRRAGS